MPVRPTIGRGVRAGAFSATFILCLVFGLLMNAWPHVYEFKVLSLVFSGATVLQAPFLLWDIMKSSAAPPTRLVLMCVQLGVVVLGALMVLVGLLLIIWFGAVDWTVTITGTGGALGIAGAVSMAWLDST